MQVIVLLGIKLTFQVISAIVQSSTTGCELNIIVQSAQYSISNVIQRQSAEGSDIKLLNPSDFFTYHQGLTLKNCTWCSLCDECFVWTSEQTATFALYIIN
jgi:hypothetical protein